MDDRAATSSRGVGLEVLRGQRPGHRAPRASSCRARSQSIWHRLYRQRLMAREKEEHMRAGFHAYDADTHVNPAAEVLDRYVDPGFRPRLADLAPYRVATSQVGGTPDTHQYRVATKFYRRVLGEASAHETFTGRGTNWRGTKQPRPGVQDDQAENRIKDMDEEGSDAHFLVATGWVSVVGLSDIELEIGLIRAWHRHAADFCGQFPTRLKTMIVASTRNPAEAVREIRQWGTSKWAVAVLPLLAREIPIDH